MNASRFLTASLTALALGACGAEVAPTDGDLPFAGEAPEVGKADQVGIDFTELLVNVESDRLARGGRAILTSAESFESYLGVPAPADLDFDEQWVAFYGAGTRNTGGYSATITGLALDQASGTLIMETEHQSPGFDCLVTQAITWPHHLVAFEVPSPEPTWYAADHTDETYRCSPTPLQLQAELATSRDAWEDARKAAGNSYTYVSSLWSFLGFSFETTIVVEDGVVIERHYKAQHAGGGDSTQWSELGADVGSHDEGHAPVLLDDLYDECANEILTLDADEYWINLSIDPDDGLLRSCTAAHRQCQDDCARGPNVTSITF